MEVIASHSVNAGWVTGGRVPSSGMRWGWPSNTVRPACATAEFRLFTRAEGAEGHCEGIAPIVFWTAALDWLDDLLARQD